MAHQCHYSNFLLLKLWSVAWLWYLSVLLCLLRRLKWSRVGSSVLWRSSRLNQVSTLCKVYKLRGKPLLPHVDALTFVWHDSLDVVSVCQWCHELFPNFAAMNVMNCNLTSVAKGQKLHMRIIWNVMSWNHTAWLKCFMYILPICWHFVSRT